MRSSPSCACAGKKGSNQTNQGQAEIAGGKAHPSAAKDVNVLANDYLAQHGERLRAEAEQAIATCQGSLAGGYPVQISQVMQALFYLNNLCA